MLNLVPLLCGLIGLLLSFIYFSWIRKVGRNDNEHLIQHSAKEKIFYRKEWMTIIIVVIVLSVVIGISLDWISSLLYVYGAATSIAIELIGSHMLNAGKSKFENYIGEDSQLFQIGFRTGASAGIFMASAGLLTLGAIFIPLNISTAISCIACYGFGVSTIVLFNETKFIAAADFYESFVLSLMAAIILTDFAVNTAHITSTFTAATAAVYPLIIAGTGLLASIIANFFVRRKERGNITVRINTGAYITAALLVIASIYLSINLLQSYLYAVALSLGVICGLISGLSAARNTSLVSVLAFAASFILSYKFIGTYGLALDAVGFVSITSFLIATSSYSLVTETNTNIGKYAEGYATCASALAVLALFVAYTQAAKLNVISITDPNVLVGLFAGAMMPIVYASIFTRKDEAEHNFDFIMRLTSFLVPGIVGMLFGAESLGAFLGGLITAGMVTSFEVSDSASINSMIKYMTAFSLVFSPVFMQYGGILY